MTAQFDNNLLRTLRGENTGKVPFWEVWFAKSDLAKKVIGGEACTFEKELEINHFFGWENMPVYAGVPGLPSAGGTASDGTSHYMPGGFYDLKQLEGKPGPDIDKIVADARPRIRAAHDAGMAAITYLPWAFHSVATAMGLENFALKTVDDIGFLHTAFNFIVENTLEVIREALVPVGVDAVLFDGDCAYKNGLMVSPKVFRELVFDGTAKLVEPLKEAGILCTLHTDGKLDDVIPVLIELGFDAVHGVEAQANDLGDIKERFGREITLMGNMDVVFLTHATPDQIRAKTRQMLDIGSPDGRYVAACNTSPCNYIPDENYLAFVETIKDYEVAR